MPIKILDRYPFYSKSITILVIYYFVMVLFWFFINLNEYINQLENYVFGLFLAIMPLLGSLFGLNVARHWGFLTSKLGKAVLNVSLGLLFWSVGTFVFAYYNLVLQQEVPYPSVADYSYLLLYVFYIIGTYYLAHATGAKSSTHSKITKFIVPVIPFIIFILSYFLFFQDAFSEITEISFEVILDLLYPLLDSVLLAFVLITVILSYRYLGGKYRSAIYIMLFGFCVEYLADFAFSKTTSDDTFYVGNWVDLLFLTCTFIVSVSLQLMSAERVLGTTNVNNQNEHRQ